MSFSEEASVPPSVHPSARPSCSALHRAIVSNVFRGSCCLHPAAFVAPLLRAAGAHADGSPVGNCPAGSVFSPLPGEAAAPLALRCGSGVPHPNAAWFEGCCSHPQVLFQAGCSCPSPWATSGGAFSGRAQLTNPAEQCLVFLERFSARLGLTHLLEGLGVPRGWLRGRGDSGMGRQVTAESIMSNCGSLQPAPAAKTLGAESVLKRVGGNGGCQPE